MRNSRFSEVKPADWDIFDALVRSTGGTVDQRGECHIQCPSCKKFPNGQVHFSFSPKGGKCFVCGHGTSLTALAAHLGTVVGSQTSAPHVEKKVWVPVWKSETDTYLDAFLSAPDRVAVWRRYKPVGLEQLESWQLGVGVLPSTRCKRRRLIVPVRAAGKIVGFRGRLIDGPAGVGKVPCADGCACPKWLTAGGSDSVLFNGDSLVAGVRHVVIVENMVDCILAEMTLPTTDTRVVSSTTGSAGWKDEWTARIRRIHPATITVWLDNDFPGGLPNTETRMAMLADWRARHPDATAPRLANGERLMERLSAEHLPVAPFHWPDGTPPKADMGGYLMGYMHEMRAA